MGLLRNYRWLKSLDEQDLPPFDYAKKAATEAEEKVAKAVARHPNVLEVHQALRLTRVEGGRTRREVDLIVVMADRLVLVEVKTYKGSVTMDEAGVLHQNGVSRHWTFGKLDDAAKRLADTMAQTGLVLGATEIHKVLLILGNATVDASVTVGDRLTKATVATSILELTSSLDRPLGEDALLPPVSLGAVKRFFSMCGTWDCLTLRNGTTMEGDLHSSPELQAWRGSGESVQFVNRRGWWGTLFRGPAYEAHLLPASGGIQTSAVDLSMEVKMMVAGGKEVSYPLDHVQEISFGYSEWVDWGQVTLLACPQEETTIAKEDSRESEGPPYSKGQVIKVATVSSIHETHGVFFTLGKEHSGLYPKRKMQEMEWMMRNNLYTVGATMSVRVVDFFKQGSKWKIEVLPLDD